jgi:carboxyl-terminal processing protease
VQEVYHMNNRMPFSFFKSAESQARPVASKITIKQFYLPDGSSTQVKGVPSDIALPSVNEFLPIGEDDLPHALPWGEVEPVDWINNWAKLNVDSPEDPALIEALAAASQARQESLEEFQFLKKQIEWRRQRYEEKAISVNLEQRIQRKIREKDYIEELDDTYEVLSENDYLMEEFLLKVTEDQAALSKKTLAEPIKEIGESIIGEGVDGTVENAVAAATELEEDEPTYDIYLRESARIMADWVQSLGGAKTATASAKKIEPAL